MEPGSTPRPLVQKKTWRDSLPIDMLLSAVSALVVAQSSSEIPEGLMNNPVYYRNTSSGIVTLCKWPSGAPDGHLQRVTIPDAVLIQFDLLMMSTTLLETWKHVEDCNKRIIK